MVASVDPVQIHEAGFYEFGAKRFDRYLLTRRKRAGEATFREFCDEIARQLTAMGLTVVDCEARPSEGEGVGAYLTQTVRIDGARDEAPCTLVLTDDDDAISYGGGASLPRRVCFRRPSSTCERRRWRGGRPRAALESASRPLTRLITHCPIAAQV